MTETRVVAQVRQAVARRAKGFCEYCLSPEEYCPDSFTIEHTMPRARGGTNELSNLAYSCQGCNNRKFTRIEALDPASGATVPLYNPRQQHWSDHFKWTEDSSLIIGLTPTGRATIARLSLNRPGVVNLRRVLHAFGKHPPSRS